MIPAYRAILVHADRSSASARRVKLAAGLAREFGATLTGIAAGVPYIPAYAPFGESFVALQPEIVEAALNQVVAALSEAETAFRAAAGDPAARWRHARASSAASFAALAARGADLIIAGAPSTDDTDPLLAMDPSDLIMSAGRPVLLVPPTMEDFAPQQIVIGWKDTRESRRAVLDAMPLLLKAKEVVVATVASPEDAVGAAEVAEWLTMHGVYAKPLVEREPEGGAAWALAKIAQRINAGLVVAGAFGHSRTREWIFGGVTRSLLMHSRTAVLFSH